MPAVVNSTVGSFSGMMEADGMTEEKGLRVRAKKGYFSDGEKKPRVRKPQDPKD